MTEVEKLEKKYIEERVRIMKKLMEVYGEEVLEIAAAEKSKIEAERVKEKYKEYIPVNMKDYYKYAFNEFENLADLLGQEILKQTEDELIVKVSSCQYCSNYSSIPGGRMIGKKMICNMDAVITEALNEAFIVERPSRMMDGDEYCIFKILRKNSVCHENNEE
ncbi:L-2-amino-thiazoline-4-carboxylic acid hydrolase [Anaeromicropila populeti]|uniref:L-2-amino-thiazoline-4-carboxylic acid hydrolase n=1 Tax=Anaeromicropila populeti TaxID=37658 RepID=A0A1I6LVP0_9FIRM|nr:L-2-amino-thiazoline-4-carboxylic acid hydrolase [Anaeromicropila populeti]SFS07527.1 L-2-amino-thiazoline-4-carboxylic acid hydrolase [Anaeromicropila populeti]